MTNVPSQPILLEFEFLFSRDLTPYEQNRAIKHFIKVIDQFEANTHYSIQRIYYSDSNRLELAILHHEEDYTGTMLYLLKSFKSTFPVKSAKRLNKIK